MNRLLPFSVKTMKLLRPFRVILLLSFLFFSLDKSYSQSTLCDGILNEVKIFNDFKSGEALYYDFPVDVFGFGTTYTKWNKPKTSDGHYSIVNEIPNDFILNGNSIWHVGQDHTPGDTGGYMLLVNANQSSGEFYRDTVSGMTIGTTYEFSSHIANIFRPATGAGTSISPNVRFEVRDLENNLLFSNSTGNIPTTNILTWTKFGIVFNAPSVRFILVMTSQAPPGTGNDLVIDDIALTACANTVAGNEDEFIQSSLKIIVKILTPLGQELQPGQATEGLFIYQYSDGSTKKVMKK